MTPAPEVTARLGTGSVSRPGRSQTIKAPGHMSRSLAGKVGATGDADRESTTDRGSPRLLDAPAIITLTQGYIRLISLASLLASSSSEIPFRISPPEPVGGDHGRSPSLDEKGRPAIEEPHLLPQGREGIRALQHQVTRTLQRFAKKRRG